MAEQSANTARVVVLDSGPLSLVLHPRGGSEAADARQWLEHLLLSGADVRIPAIADYELRREFLRAGRTRSVERLEALEREMDYIPITTAAMQRAAELWARLRNAGLSTASPESLDGDMILAAQALGLSEELEAEAVVATTNPGHLARAVSAARWSDIVVS